MADVLDVFQCSACDRVHLDCFDAEECCNPEVVFLYRCEECEELHDFREEAEQCCDFDEDNLSHKAWQNHISKLEGAGQLRLVD